MKMELLQKALFNLPRTQATEQAARTLDKLGLSQFYSSPSSVPGVEAVSPNIVFDVASLVLYGTHAIPVRLKILMDRLFSVLREEEVVQILKGYGWTLEDYHRGYILKDPRGTPLDRWTMCSKEEEPLVLQQFLRFGETRLITQQLLLQESSERHQEEQRTKAQNEIKKLIERNNSLASEAVNPPSPSLQQALNNSGGGGSSSSGGSHNGAGHTASVGDEGSAHSPARRGSPSLPSESPDHRTKSPEISRAPSTPVNGTPVTSAASPLNRLQNMQPYDYRNKDGMASPEATAAASMAAAAAAALQQHRNTIERPVPPTISPMRLPPSSSAASMGLPIMPSVSMPPTLASYHNSFSFANKAKKESPKMENTSSALNLSRERDSGESGQAARKSGSNNGEDGIQQEMKKKLRDNIGISYVSPTTGKKRVQCNVCLKTFCDKGALKIHFSAVHLREMHKCSVEGCNMMFSSRRSRNRHSANPNPKLHTPHLRRKISPHDGRTHQGPFLPALAALTTGHMKEVMPTPPMLGNALQGNPFMQAGMLSPELQSLQRQQMEIQRLHEMKMNSLYAGRQMEAFKAAEIKEDFEEPESKRTRLSDSENEDIVKTNDDDKSIGDQSAKDEVSSGTHSTSGGGGRKRKSQNPTRITTMQSNQGNNAGEEGGDYSSDDDDEGFENPLDDNDEDLDDDDDDDEPSLGGKGGHGMGGSGGDNREDASKDDRPSDGHDDSQQNGNQSPKDSNQPEKDVNEEANNNLDSAQQMPGRSPSPNPEQPSVFFGDIPVDKENPKRCIECGQEFPNHFGVKTHYQDVHLKLMHKCTVEGCNAGFPSKRSRDRHSSNLNLHRKLLSTSSSSPTHGNAPEFGKFPQIPSSYQSELLTRLYTQAGNENPFGLFANLNGLAAAGALGNPFDSVELESKLKALSSAHQAALQPTAKVGNYS